MWRYYILGLLTAVVGASVASPASDKQLAHTINNTNTLQAPQGDTGSIVCFGDSWAAFACDNLAQVVALNGKPNKVINKGVAGSTATFWSNNTDLMLANIVSSGIPSFIWLSIGGDDILDGYAQHVCEPSPSGQAACNARIFTAMDTMLSTIISKMPFIQIVQFGYDFTNFVYSPECIALAAETFGVNVTQYEINSIFLNWATQVLQPLSQKYNILNYQYTAMWGTLQAAGGSQYTPSPYPNVYFPSPEPYMNDGCIHASQLGWDTMLGNLYNLYFRYRL